MAKRPNGTTGFYTITEMGKSIELYHGRGNRHYPEMVKVIEPVLRMGKEIHIIGEDEQTAFNVAKALRIHEKKWGKDFKNGWVTEEHRLKKRNQYRLKWNKPVPEEPILTKHPTPKKILVSRTKLEQILNELVVIIRES